MSCTSITSGDDGQEAAARRLAAEGVVLLRHAFPTSLLTRLRQAAAGCFAAVDAGTTLPERYKFNRFSNSMLVAALAGARFAGSQLSEEDLIAPLESPELAALFSEALSGEWGCRLEHSWVRKKFAPGNPPDGRDVSQGWHQDGALWARFPRTIDLRDESGYWVSIAPMTELVTCWIPLETCGRDAPGLEFVLGPQPGLLHFTELDDTTVRARFAAERFWAPEMEPGDAVIFLNSVLHRTFVNGGMPRDRISVEYRVFARAKATDIE